MHLRIRETIAETTAGTVLMMDAGPYTGVFAPIPVSLDDRAGMREAVAKLAQHYMDLPDDADLVNGEEMSVADIKAAISERITEEDHVSHEEADA